MRESSGLTITQRIAERWDYFGLPALFIILVILFSSLSPAFRTFYNLLANLQFASFVGVSAVGMIFLISSGDFDISVGSMLALVAVFGGSFVPALGGPLGAIATVAAATGLGLLNGIFVTKLRIPAFITTLGMMFIYRALAYIYTDNTPVTIQSRFWFFVGNGKIAGIPFAFILMLICFGTGFVLLRKSPFGRFVIAVGSNKNAAILAGINFDGIKILVFMMVGFFVGISSVIMASNFGSANPGMMGQGFEFQVITAVVLGGTLLGGGTANLLGGFFAALIITFLRNGLGLLQVNSYWQFVAIGLVLIFAVAINRIRFALLGYGEV